MKLAELIVALQALLEKEGNLNVYCGDMQAPELELAEPVDMEDYVQYGHKYLFIKEA